MPNFSNLSSIDPKYPNLTVIVPAYNEEKSIASLILKLKEYAGNIILVDDGSPDETTKIAKYVMSDYIIKNATNLGQHKSILIGLEKAKEIQGEYILFSDFYGIRFSKFEFINNVMEPLVKNPDLDACFGIYENVYDYYNSKNKTNSEKNILKYKSNIVFFIIRTSVITDSVIIPEFNEEFETNWLDNKKISLVRLNLKKESNRSRGIIIMSILFFVFASISYLIAIILLSKIFASFIYDVLPVATILFFGILCCLTYWKYKGDLDEHYY